MSSRVALTLFLLAIAVTSSGCDRAREVTAATAVVEPEQVYPSLEVTHSEEELPFVTVTESIEISLPR